MNDKVIRQHVIDELDFEPSVDAAHIGVTVDKGIVTLTGHVRSYAEKVTAEHAVRRVRGVLAIAEEIKVSAPGDKPIEDEEIARRCLHVLAWSALLPAGLVKVEVDHGWVRLAGTVDWQHQRSAAESAIRKLSGIIGVSNLIDVKAKPRVEPTEIKKRIEDAFRRNAQIDANAIKVDVANDRVTLEGTVREWQEKIVAGNAAWGAPGVNAVVDHLRVG